RCPADDRAEADHRVVAPALGEPAGDERDLERARHPGDVDVLLLNAVSDEPIQRALVQLRRDEVVEPRHDDAKAQPAPHQLSLESSAHPVNSSVKGSGAPSLVAGPIVSRLQGLAHASLALKGPTNAPSFVAWSPDSDGCARWARRSAGDARPPRCRSRRAPSPS